MDFSPLYPHSSASQIHFSPGSTFVLSLFSNVLVVRTAQDLSLVRSWTLPSDAAVDQLSWSPDGAYFLAASTGSGLVRVFVLDPRRQPAQGAVLEDEEDGAAPAEDVGAVAIIEVGPSKLLSAAWAPSGAPPTILTFSPDELGMTAHCLADSSRAFFPDVKRARHFPHPTDRSCFALLHRSSSASSPGDYVSIYRYIQTSLQPSAGGYAALLGKATANAPALASNWFLEATFFSKTSDSASLSWSPDGNLVAVWETSMEYKLNLFTATGQSRGTLTVPLDKSNPAFYSPHSDALEGEQIGKAHQGRPATANEEEDAAQLAGGGLGIRTVSWQVLSGSTNPTMLAVGGYDDRVQLLTPFADSPNSGDWSLVPLTINTGQKSLKASISSALTFREPKDWIKQTGGRGIVPLHEDYAFPVSPPALKPDWDKAHPKAGVHWSEWDPSGMFLACRNETLPSTILIYGIPATSLPYPTQPPTLIAVILFSSAVSACTWRPAAVVEKTQNVPSSRKRPQLAVVSGSAAVYLWEWIGGIDIAAESNGPLHRVDGVPVPIAAGEVFKPTTIKYSSDGQKLFLASASGGDSSDSGTYCVSVAVQDDEDDGGHE